MRKEKRVGRSLYYLALTTQPFYRKAEHLRLRGSLTLALSAIARSLELAENGSLDLIRRKQTEIEGLREIAQIEKARRISRANRDDKQILINSQRVEAKRTQDFTHLLSPDILDLIIDHLIVDNPSVACKIGAVRRSWRGWIMARPGAWQHLELGGRRPVEKAKMFLERGRGVLRSLRILDTFPSTFEIKAAEILSAKVENIKTFAYSGYPSELIQHLSGQFNSLEEIVELPSKHPKLVRNRQSCGNLLDAVSSLQSITLIDGQVTLSTDAIVSRRIHSFRMRHGSISSASGSLIPMLQCMPDLEEIILHNVNFLATAPPLGQVEGILHRLGRFSISSTPHEAPDPSSVVLDFFDKISTPNLDQLSVWRYTQDLPSLFRSPGLAPCLSRLQGLDIGHTTVAETALLLNLEMMTQLSFLNVSCTALTDTFLKAITFDGKGKDLLPNLIALSMAALDVTSLALRDFAISRLPKSAKIYLTQPTEHQVTKSSAFRPLSSSSNPSSQNPANVASSAVMPRPNQQSPKRFLKWLCLDHCETIDHQLIEYLRTKILFVSAGKVRNEERIRGEGKYDWNLQYYDSCVADDPKERCKLVAIPGESLASARSS